MYTAGQLYATGAGVPQDRTAAMRWYTLAAEQGHSLAQYSLGNAFADGDGEHRLKDQAKAVASQFLFGVFLVPVILRVWMWVALNRTACV